MRDPEPREIGTCSRCARLIFENSEYIEIRFDPKQSFADRRICRHCVGIMVMLPESQFLLNIMIAHGCVTFRSDASQEALIELLNELCPR